MSIKTDKAVRDQGKAIEAIKKRLAAIEEQLTAPVQKPKAKKVE